MNPFRRWLGRARETQGEASVDDPDAVFRLLCDAVARNDGDVLVALCRQHARTIVDHFGVWRTVPESMRGDPQIVARRAGTLIRVAQLFEQAGHPGLMALLVGNAEDNPLLEWERVGVELQRLAKMGDPRQGLAAASALVASIEASGVSGPGFLSTRAKARGVQAMLLVKLARYEEAREAVEAALADCEQAGDLEGVRVYRQNLAILDSEHPTLPGRIDLEIAILEQVRLAQRRTDLRRYRSSNALIEQLLATSGDAAPIIERLRPHLLARSGFNELKLGHLDVAHERIRAARDACRADQDEEGVEVYEENLAAVERIRAASDTRPGSGFGATRVD
jgi:tetratricopeptide (TPR) repeat protein